MGRKVIDLVGQSYGRLTVLEKGSKSGTQYKWLCQCSCGSQPFEVHGNSLRQGVTQSCGCLRRERAAEANTKHGLYNAYAATYHIWASMIHRCTNPNSKNYKDYGARGITVCDRWLSFENFLADIGDRPERLTLERIDNSSGYEPDNCRWATRTEQQRNTRRNRMITWGGKTQCIAAWAEELGLPRTTMMTRLRCGWSVERIFTTPVVLRKAA